MTLLLSIGGEMLLVRGPSPLLEDIRSRYGRFECDASRGRDGRPAIVLELRGEHVPCPEGLERPAEIGLRAVSGDEIGLGGPISGRYRPEDRRGSFDGAWSVATFDAVMRVVLATTLPLHGAVLMHAAALGGAAAGAVALCGDSGAGKSTAAAALGAACDELVVLRLSEDAVDLFATPYWRGRPLRTSCSEILCLERGGSPAVVRRRGAEAFRTVLRHAVRHVALPRVETALLAVVARVCERAVVRTAMCPEGERFLPFLRRVLPQQAGVA